MKVMLALFSLLLGSAVAQTQPSAAKSPSKSGSALEAKVRAVWEGFHKKDKAAVSALLDDSLRTISDGDSEFGGKNSEISDVDAYTIEKYDLTNFHVQHLGADAAIVTYTAEYSGQFEGKPVHTRGIFGEVWQKRGSDWKEVYSQETGLH
jgi:Domain of unknown function (DUF4440)